MTHQRSIGLLVAAALGRLLDVTHEYQEVSVTDADGQPLEHTERNGSIILDGPLTKYQPIYITRYVEAPEFTEPRYHQKQTHPSSYSKHGYRAKRRSK